jgi:hypothetical protein
MDLIAHDLSGNPPNQRAAAGSAGSPVEASATAVAISETRDPADRLRCQPPLDRAAEFLATESAAILTCTQS